MPTGACLPVMLPTAELSPLHLVLGGHLYGVPSDQPLVVDLRNQLCALCTRNSGNIACKFKEKLRSGSLLKV